MWLQGATAKAVRAVTFMAAQNLRDREWSLPASLCKLLQVSAFGDVLPSAMRQANLKALQVRGATFHMHWRC